MPTLLFLLSYLLDMRLFRPIHIIAAVALRKFLPLFIGGYLKKKLHFTGTLRVVCRGSLIEVKRYHLLLSDFDITLIFDSLENVSISALQGHLKQLRSILWPLGEVEIMSNDEREKLVNAFKSEFGRFKVYEIYTVLKHIRKVRTLKDRLRWKTDPWNNYKHKRATLQSWQFLFHWMGLPLESVATYSQCIEVSLALPLTQMANICVSAFNENAQILGLQDGSLDWHPYFNFKLKIDSGAAYSNDDEIYLNPQAFYALFHFLSPLSIFDNRSKKMFNRTPENIRAMQSLFTIEEIKLRAFVRSTREVEQWVMDWLNKLEKFNELLCVDRAEISESKAYIDALDSLVSNSVSGGQTFIQIGGLDNFKLEKVSTAWLGGASTVAFLDQLPESSLQWPELQLRLKKLNCDNFQFYNTDLLDYVGPGFDVVYCAYRLYHYSDFEGFLKALKLLAREKVILTTLVLKAESNLAEDKNIVFVPELSDEKRKLLHSQFGFENMIGLDAPLPVPLRQSDRRVIWWLSNKSYLMNLCENCGFKIVSCDPHISDQSVIMVLEPHE